MMMFEERAEPHQRRGTSPDEKDVMDDDTEDDELEALKEYFGVTIKKRHTSPHPYKNASEYVPRSQRR